MLAGFEPGKIQNLEGARIAIRSLLNLVEEMKAENQRLRKEVGELRDEVNRLKGEQGRPDIKADKPKKEKSDHSSEKERRQPKSWQKESKNDKIKIDRIERLSVDTSGLPADARPNGYEKNIVQDLCIRTDNILFIKEEYYSPSQGTTYLAPMPAGYQGQFGPSIRSLVTIGISG